EVTEALNGISESQLSIPLGTLSGTDIFYGVGPRVPIKIVPYGYAVADIETRFYDTGINQTAFEVVAKVHANVSVLMPTIRQSMKITASVPVASAVVVGDVPDSYTNVERHGLDYEDDVLELIE
ncbi:MAG: sporulation protein YunB, partial [Clostridia bacterium]|nr:sporulation protein YunB [Clostridia bacterium]